MEDRRSDGSRSGRRSGALARRALALLRRLWPPGGRRGRRWALPIAAGGAAAALLVAAILRPAPPGGRARLFPRARRPVVIGFFENGWSQIFGDSFPAVFQHRHAISTVLAFWYSVDGNSRLIARQPRPNVVRWVKDHHMRMGVLINNVPGPAHDDAGMLWTKAARMRAIDAIVARAKEDGYQELHIDFELLPPRARNGLTAFVRELKAAVPKGVAVSVSVLPPVGVPRALNGAYDYAALARSADYLVLMAYDHHSSGGPAGPVSPLPWVDQNVRALTADGVPAGKLVLAAGIYGYDWIKGTSEAEEIPLSEVDARIAKFHLKPQWDAAAAEPFVTYTDSRGRPRVIWYQDARTLRQRLLLVKRDHLKGIAIWRLGLGTPRVWSVIDTVLRSP